MDELYEITLMFPYGSMSFKAELSYHGDGSLEEFFEEVLQKTYPDATCVSISEAEE